MRRNTLDLDFCDKETLDRIWCKILHCPQPCDGGCADVYIKDTAKGYHLTMRCYNDCDLCRLVFDDPVRYSRDLRRPVWSRDVLFDSKELIHKSEM